MFAPQKAPKISAIHGQSFLLCVFAPLRDILLHPLKGDEIPLRLLENLEDLLGSLGGAERLANRPIVEELGDGGQGAEMGLELILGHDEKNDEPDGGVVEGFELDAVGGAAEGGDNGVDAVGGGMRNGNAETDAGAHRLLPGAESGEHGLLVFGLDFVLGNQEFDQFHDGAPPFGGFHIGKYLFNRQEVAKIHACCFVGKAE